MMARTTDSGQYFGARVQPSYIHRRSDPVLRRVLFDPEHEGSWTAADGSAQLTYHRHGDYFAWTVDGRPGWSPMTEDAIAALDRRPALRLVTR